MRFLKQYNKFADNYVQQIQKMNAKSISEFREAIRIIKPPGKRVVDLGCGSADLAQYLMGLGYEYFGIDSAEEMLVTAKRQGVAIQVGDFTNTGLAGKSFDLAVSKWALQTTNDIDAVYKECSRLLKPSGWIVFLVTHPLRQFLEKKGQEKNYFTQEIVESHIFDGTLIVKEPSHTLMDYFSNYFLSEFSLKRVQESFEFPGAEQINGDIYPTHLLITAQKK